MSTEIVLKGVTHRDSTTPAKQPSWVLRKPGFVACTPTALLQNLVGQIIRKATLTVVTPDGRVHAFGSGAHTVRTRITDWPTVRRLFIDPDLALAEAYMSGGLVCEVGHINDLLDLCMSNLGCGPIHGPQRFRTAIRYYGPRFAQHNTPRLARSNVAHHYDLCDTLYAVFSI